MTKVTIRTDFITLGQFLKLADCISTGGQAKHFLKTYKVRLNGETEQRRGKKIVAGDVIEIDGFGQFEVIQAT